MRRIWQSASGAKGASLLSCDLLLRWNKKKRVYAQGTQEHFRGRISVCFSWGLTRVGYESLKRGRGSYAEADSPLRVIRLEDSFGGMCATSRYGVLLLVGENFPGVVVEVDFIPR